jgi:hypothetical protein
MVVSSWTGRSDRELESIFLYFFVVLTFFFSGSLRCYIRKMERLPLKDYGKRHWMSLILLEFRAY